MIQLPNLIVDDAVAAIILNKNKQYLLQLRDDYPHIYFPGRWGLFGGAIEKNETELDAIRRELYEELEFQPKDIDFFSRFNFDINNGEKQINYFRSYFICNINDDEATNLKLHEGKNYGFYSEDKILTSMQLTPYDYYSIWTHSNLYRLKIKER